MDNCYPLVAPNMFLSSNKLFLSCDKYMRNFTSLKGRFDRESIISDLFLYLTQFK